jgi:hypothetical protein
MISHSIQRLFSLAESAEHIGPSSGLPIISSFIPSRMLNEFLFILH